MAVRQPPFHAFQLREILVRVHQPHEFARVRGPGLQYRFELVGIGESGEEIAAELRVSAATLYNWRRQYGRTTADKLRSRLGRAHASCHVVYRPKPVLPQIAVLRPFRSG
ncbi:transposase [Nocardia sp. NPDC049707]|uniref:transposase n=1 Tax=Nocardia sp. NPDC049707 TaxID=3154735 RepID=UPI003413EB3A